MRAGERPVRVLGYARVSSPEQALGTSLQDQQDAIRAFAKERSLEVARFFVEAETAIYERVERRDQMRGLLEDVRAGDLIVCDKLDRWSRDPEFTYRTVRQILEAKASFYAVSDRCDPSTKDGDTMLGFRVLVAREEHKRIKERMVGTRKLLRDRGFYVEGLPPFGYQRSRPRGSKGADKNVLRIVEEDAALVCEAFKRCARGESIDDIRKHLSRARRSRSWDKKLVGRMLRNRVYLGEALDSRGVWIDGQQAAIISRDIFARAQQGLDSRRLGGAKSSSSSHTSTWLLRDVASCAMCGAKISAAYGSLASNSYAYYYRCGKRCGARYMPVVPADAAVSLLVEARLVELRTLLAAGAEPTKAAKVIDFADEKARLQRKRERFLEAFAEVGMTKAELRTALAKIDEQRGKVEAKEAEQKRHAPLATKELRRKVLAHVSQIQKSWRAAPIELRREIIRELVLVVGIERDAEPAIEWKTAEAIAGDRAPMK